MIGDPNNVAVWGDADMYVTYDLDAAIPADENTAFDPDVWDAFGILNGEKGISEASDKDETKIPGWGWGIVRTGYKNFATSWKFTTLEDNDVSWALRNPNSTAPDISADRTPVPVKLAYEIRDGDRVKRKITKGYALVTQDGEVNITESGAAETSFIAWIYPDDERNIFTEQPDNIGS
jgi:hypothetical protein